MKDNLSRTINTAATGMMHRLTQFGLAIALALTWNSLAFADHGGRGGENDGGDDHGNGGQGGNVGQGEKGNRGDNDRDDNDGKGYRQINLVADQPGVAMLLDTNLVNAWGISFGPSTPFWISDNGSGLSTLYAVTNDSMGMPHVAKQGLEVVIPGDGSVTGQLFNNTTGFHTNLFIFASEDGTISGWRPALGTTAEILAMPADSIYKGITLISNASGPMLLAANFSQGTVDAYDSDMNLVGQFSDSNAPDGYAPFNVQNLSGIIFVTFAKQDAAKEDDVPGVGHGLVDIFNPRTGRFHRFTTGSDAGGRNKAISSPWGLAISPAKFGEDSDELLVGNFGSGTIMAFDDHGRLKGLLEDTHDRPIIIDGLWALTFGNGTKSGVPGTLYFTAGPDDESHGLFGQLEPAKKKEHGHGHGH
jgi:uncharacterized protein (TIGR03118 family)